LWFRAAAIQRMHLCEKPVTQCDPEL
jgi:hypothetical protein